MYNLNLSCSSFPRWLTHWPVVVCVVLGLALVSGLLLVNQSELWFSATSVAYTLSYISTGLLFLLSAYLFRFYCLSQHYFSLLLALSLMGAALLDILFLLLSSSWFISLYSAENGIQAGDCCYLGQGFLAFLLIVSLLLVRRGELLGSAGRIEGKLLFLVLLGAICSLVVLFILHPIAPPSWHPGWVSTLRRLMPALLFVILALLLLRRKCQPDSYEPYLFYFALFALFAEMIAFYLNSTGKPSGCAFVLLLKGGSYLFLLLGMRMVGIKMLAKPQYLSAPLSSSGRFNFENNRKWGRFSIGVKLSLLMLGLAALAVGITFATLYYQFTSAMEEERAFQLSRHAEQDVRELLQLFEGVNYDLTQLGYLPVTGNLIRQHGMGNRSRLQLYKTMQNLFNQEENYRHFAMYGWSHNQLELLLEHGQQRCITEEIKAQLHPVSFKYEKAQKATSYIQLSAERKPYFCLVLPVQDMVSTRQGLISLTVDLNPSFNALLQGLESGASLTIFDGNQQVLWHGSTQTQNLISNQQLTEMVATPSVKDFFTSTNQDYALLQSHLSDSRVLGLQKFNGLQRQTVPTLVIAYHHLSSSLIKRLNDGTAQAILTSIVVLLLVLLVAWLVTHIIVSPLRYISYAVELFGASSKKLMLPVKARDEVGVLARAFDRMRHQVRERTSQLEAEIEQHKRSQHALAKAMEQANAAAVAKGEFMATMSHEIRTPLNGVLGMTQLLKETPLTSEQMEFLDIIYSSGSSLMSVLNDVLDFSKIEAGKLTVETVPFDLEQLGYDLLELQSTSLTDKPVQILFDYGQQLPQIFLGDPERLRQVLINVVANAVKFTQQGEIVLTVTRSEGMVEMRVADTGIGIESKRLEAIFDLFSQADNSTTRQFGGTGLGLTICRKLVELMAGTIVVDSEPGKGSCFIIRLPLEAVEQESNDISCFCQRHPDISNSPLLLLSNASASGDLLTHYLESAGLPVQPHRFNEAVCAELAHSRAELVIVDLRADDLELMQQLKTQPIWSTRSLLVVLPYQSRQAIIQSFPANWVIVKKPFIAKRLLSALLMAFSTRSSQRHHDDPAPVKSGSPYFNGHILLVEDTIVNQKVAMGMLQSCGLQVTAVTDGAQAVIANKKNSYDLILMDCLMPVMDGYEASRQIREFEKQSGRHRVPIIAMTASVLGGAKMACIQAGMDQFLAKPFVKLQLIELISLYLTPLSSDGATLESEAQAISELSEEQMIELTVWLRLKQDLGDGFSAVLDVYKQDTREMINEMTELLDCNDLTTFHRFAHSIKSSSRYFGLCAVANLAEELELASEQGGSAEVNDTVDALKQRFEKSLIIAARLAEQSE